MGPHSLASKFQVADSSPFKGSSSRRGFSDIRETSIRARKVDLHPPQGVRGVNHGDLRLFIDSAKPKDWEQFLPSGIFYGVTTNPFLLKDAHVPCDSETLKHYACNAFAQGITELQLQTWGRNAKEMYDNGQDLAFCACGGSSIVVKVPCTEDGLKAAKELVKANIRVTMTGLYSVHQVLLAIGVGATYAAPYLNRMNTVDKPGMEYIKNMQTIIGAMKSDMRLLVASINEVEQVTKLAACGVNSFAIKEGIIRQLLQDPHTNNIAQLFEQAVAQNKVAMGEYKRSKTI